MSLGLAKKERHVAARDITQSSAGSLKVQQATNADQHEVLTFLAIRPLHTLTLVGLIRDNGLESPLNRGQFYTARNSKGKLVGVALIGHATLVETESDDALRAFARIAHSSGRTHMLMGEQDKVERFWNYHAGEGEVAPHLLCRELLFEQRWPVEVREAVRGLRQATLDDLNLIMPVHACMAFEESGVNPLERDPVGFRLRCARRIEQGHVWLCVEDGRLIFKADVMADTAQAVYLEGVYTSPAARNRSHGARCLQEVARLLLLRTRAVILLVNEQNQKAQEFYRSAGFRSTGVYDTIYLQPAG